MCANVAAELRAFWFAVCVSLAWLCLGVSLGGCALTQLQVQVPAERPAHIGTVAVVSTFALSEPVMTALNEVVSAHAASVSSSSSSSSHEDAADHEARLITVLGRNRHQELVGGGLDRQGTTYDHTTYVVRMVLLDADGKQIGGARVELEEDTGTLQHDPARERVLIQRGLQRGLRALLGPQLPAPGTVAAR